MRNPVFTAVLSMTVGMVTVPGPCLAQILRAAPDQSATTVSRDAAGRLVLGTELAVAHRAQAAPVPAAVTLAAALPLARMQRRLPHKGGEEAWSPALLAVAGGQPR